jgi:hypothetical protein
MIVSISLLAAAHPTDALVLIIPAASSDDRFLRGTGRGDRRYARAKKVSGLGRWY